MISMDKEELIKMLRSDLDLEVNAEAYYEDFVFILKDKEAVEKLAKVLVDTHKHISAFSRLIQELEKPKKKPKK